MRLSYLLELVLAMGVGLGLARFRLGNPEWQISIATPMWFAGSQNAIDAALAGALLVGGLGTLVERLRGKSPTVWGPGRWAWVSLAALVLLTTFDNVLGSIAAGHRAFLPRTVAISIKEGLCDRYYKYFPNGVAMFLLAIALTWLAAPARQPSADAREWAGRAIACLLVVSMLAFQALNLLDYVSLWGGGMRGAFP